MKTWSIAYSVFADTDDGAGRYRHEGKRGSGI